MYVHFANLSAWNPHAFKRGSLPGLLAYVLGFDNEVTEFELQSRYFVQFWTNTYWKGWNYPILQF